MITLNNVSKSFGNKNIINDINLTIQEGELTFIVGTSGAGKTTLLNLIGGLDKASKGEILLNGENIQTDLDGYRANKTGFVFQDFNLISGLSITQNVKVAALLSGTDIDYDNIKKNIIALGAMEPNQKVETLSGGEKQRAAIVRSICKDADIIIADEPTGNLDSSNAELVLDLLHSLKANKHIIIVSHDIDKAKKYADRIITLKDGAIFKDESIKNDCPTKVSDKKRKADIPSSSKIHALHALLILGINSIKLRKGKIISIALVIALAIASISTVLYLQQSGNNISHNINVNYLENDLISLYYNNTPNAGLMELPFNNNEIQSIQDDYDIKEMVLLYQDTGKNWLVNVNDRTSEICIKQININSFFENRVMSNDIEGEFLSNKNEIILSEDIAYQLFDGNGIGSSVTLNDGIGNSITLKVVGINHTKNPFDQIYSFVSSEIIKDMLLQHVKNTMFSRQELSTYFNEVQNMSVGGIYGSMNAILGDEKIIYGESATTYNNIIISSELLRNVLTYFGIEDSYSYEQIISNSMKEDDINQVFNKKLALNYNGVFPIYISGIYESKDIEMRFTNELIQEMEKIEPIILDIYVAQPNFVPEIKKEINNNENFEANTQLETLKTNVSMQTGFFSISLIILGVILIMISVALLSSFSKISVLERKTEIAIVKSLGASNRIVLFLLLFDSAIIVLASYLLSLALCIAMGNIIPAVIPNMEMLTTGFPLLLTSIVCLIFAIFVFIQTGVTLNSLAKKMPATLLKQ